MGAQVRLPPFRGGKFILDRNPKGGARGGQAEVGAGSIRVWPPERTVYAKTLR